MIGHIGAGAGLAAFMGAAIRTAARNEGKVASSIEFGEQDTDWHPESPHRGRGRTSSQMRRAPLGSVYIWPEQQSIGYARHLAHHLGRDDLIIKHIRALDGGADQLRGLKMPGLIVDHACWSPQRMSKHREQALHRLQPYVGRG